MPADSGEWYYLAGNQRVGPADSAGLQALVDAGTLGPDSLVWAAGMEDWQPVSAAFNPAVSERNRRLANQATWSLVLGVISVFGLFIFVTLPAALAGLVLGIKGRHSSRRGQAIAGIILSSPGLLVFVWLAVGFGRAIVALGRDQFVVQFLAAFR